MPGAIQSVERAAAMLQLIADNPGQVSLTDIAESLGLAKATAHGLLRTLQEVGFVSLGPDGGSAPHRYALGPALLGLGDSRLDRNELRSHAVNWADSLAGRSGEAVQLAALESGAALVLHHVFRPDDSEQTLEVGLELPAHATALGKVLLAWSPLLGRHARSTYDRFTGHTVTSPKALVRSLVPVRAQGWAAEAEEYTRGMASIAAPVRRAGGQVVAAIGISGSIDRVCDSLGQPRPGLVALVTGTAEAVSRDLATARR
jgi:DNA-binding IclR family transcriptional regulator